MRFQWMMVHMKAEWVAAFAGVAQGAGVIPAVIIGARALRGDRNDRKVDRVLALHEELTGGELDEARRQVVRRARQDGQPITKPMVHKTPGQPADDQIGKLLRFFERVETVRIAGSADMPMLTELVGRHAAWLDIAVHYDPNSKARRPMHTLALAVNQFAETKRRSKRYHYLQGWGRSRRSDFSETVLRDYKVLCEDAMPSAAGWDWLQGI